VFTCIKVSWMAFFKVLHCFKSNFNSALYNCISANCCLGIIGISKVTLFGIVIHQILSNHCRCHDDAGRNRGVPLIYSQKNSQIILCFKSCQVHDTSVSGSVVSCLTSRDIFTSLTHSGWFVHPLRFHYPADSMISQSCGGTASYHMTFHLDFAVYMLCSLHFISSLTLST